MRVTKHPSGRPIKRPEKKSVGYLRIPEDGPLNPRMRRKNEQTEAIGFTAHLVRREDDSQD